MDGMIPPGTLGMGAPGGVYGGDGMGGGGMFGSGKGVLGGLFAKAGPPGLYGGIDYLYWIPKSQDLDFPLVTTSAPADFGVLGGATTVGLCPADRDISYDYTNGWRVWLGWGLGEDGALAFEVGGFYLQTAKRDFNFASNAAGVPVLAIPFFDVATGTQASYIVSFPGINSGSIDIVATTQAYSAEANLVYRMYGEESGKPGGMSLFAGVRYFHLDESLDIRTRSQTFGEPPAIPGTASFFPATGGIFAGTSFTGLGPFLVTTTDTIRTYNDFFGGQVGARSEIGFGKWFVETTGKAAAGYMRQRVDLDGISTLTTAGGLVSAQPGGFFNSPVDLCRTRKDEFACLLEGGINVGCQLGSMCRVHAGYTFLWVNNVLRPTSVTTPVLNAGTIPVSPTFTGAMPAVFVPRDVVRDTEFFLHGINVGVSFAF
jgi:hypothetical protein